MQRQQDAQRVEQFANQVLGDLGAAASSVLVHLGDRLGLYRAMDGAGPLRPAELAERTGTTERYVREWLNNQAASGYVVYHAGSGRYELPVEHAAVLADEDSPAFMGGGFMALPPMFADQEKIEQAFRSGEGLGWSEHDPRICFSTERFFRPTYNSRLVQEWIPALDGVEARLEQGARVADIGCGHGASTILMGRAYPSSSFVGYDYDAKSIATARRRAAEAGVEDRVRFEVAGAKSLPAAGYDLITFFDCLHDMGDPVGAARNARESLASGGTLMVVEPRAGDAVEENLNPVGRAYYAFSTMICTPTSLAQEVGLGLGAQAGEARLREVLTEAGFTRIRRATETPFNMVLEARG